MFHWICPECGREIPPAVKECPACDPSSVAVSVALEAPSLAQTAPQPPPLPGPLLRLAQKLRETQRDLPVPVLAPRPPAAPAQPQGLLQESAPAALYREVLLLAPPEPEPEPLPEPPRELEPQPADLSQDDLTQHDLNRLSPSPATLSDAPVNDAPRPVRETDPATAGAVPTPNPLPLASPPAAATPYIPISAELAQLPAASPSASALTQPALIAASSPSTPLLALASLQDSSALFHRIRVASSPTPIARTGAGPLLTLPGPTLPAALNSLQDAGLSRILVDRPRAAGKGSSGWLVSALVAALLLTALLGIVLFNAPRSAADPKPTPPQEVHAAAPEPAVPPAISTAASYSLTKAIEVTGFRFVGDNKPELRYLVVNHSGAELGAVTVYVTLRSSAAKPGQAPLYRFSFRAPNLGPFESKEMAATADKPPDKLVRTAADWQSLHADIELGQ